MIATLRGVVAQKDPPHVVVDVSGVGYELEVPVSTWAALPEVGQPVTLRTHQVIREDQHLLYGFATEAEKRVFRDLLRVNGVGPKIALAILSGISVDGLLRAVQTEDVTALTRVPGVGRKTAERLILDLKDRVATLAGNVGGATAVTPLMVGASSMEREVVEALMGLGYRPVEARRMVEQARPETADSTADLLRAALRNASGVARGAAAGPA
ncbi:MAG: Holliday junction branch migration protein RuvA [Gammaproteobacteria bacterium]|nr:Holliday junction branch migration protein RuvA [Gammaproteobacteria bacterium]